MNIKEIYKIFFPKSFSEKYRHVGYSYPSVSSGWKDIVEQAVIRIEKIMWPQKYLPLFVKRLIHYLATGNSVVRIKYYFFHDIRNRLTNNQILTDIKDKYAGLRIYGYYCKDIEKIIDNAVEHCDNTCENCGSKEDVKISGKNWYVNLCINCRQ
jgi:hypothetical protein